MVMTSVEFKAWRDKLGYSQQAAADALGISKGSVELYERGSRRDDNRPVDIPQPVEFACERATRLWKQRQPELGPVQLIYADGSMTQPIDGRLSRVPMMQIEQYPTNREAVDRACLMMKSPNFHNPFIKDGEDDVVWKGVELRAECRRREKPDGRRAVKVVACPECGFNAWITGPADNRTVNLQAAEMTRLCKHIDEQTDQFRCPVMQAAIEEATERAAG
jgi:transcriptional regulator with XRE-family HTH domain